MYFLTKILRKGDNQESKEELCSKRKKWYMAIVLKLAKDRLSKNKGKMKIVM